MAHVTAPLAEALMRYLKKQSLVVDRATFGFQAYSMAYLNDYDVMILGVEMPGLSGRAVCEKLRDKGSALPILYWYSKTCDAVERIEALQVGADVCVPDVSDFSEVLMQLRALTRRKLEWRRPVYVIQGVTVDCNQMLLYRDQQVLTLSPKEFRILEYLGSHQGKVMSRAQVLENVWGSEGYMMSNVIDVHMSRLRRKVQDAFAIDLIRTVRGEGYLMAEAVTSSPAYTSLSNLKQ